MFQSAVILSAIWISTVISYEVKYTVRVLDEKKNITQAEITPTTLGESEVKYVTVVRRYDVNDDIDMVANFPKLERFEMKVQQDIIPEFANLPSLKQLDLDQNKFKYIKREAFSAVPVQRVYINHNELSQIEKRAFGLKVQSVSIRCNKLTTFSEHWFKNLSSLVELNMGGNLLTTIEPYQFKNLPNLNDIVLSYNDITSIGEGAFSNRGDFYFLYIPYNRIKEINPKIFKDEKIIINNFAVNNNRLTFLAPDLMKKLKIITSIEIDDNPWQCACWSQIKSWVPNYLNIFRDSGRPVCVASLSFNEHCVPFVDHELIEHYEKNSDPPHYNTDWYCK